MAYFDAASAEPLHPSAREAFLAALDDGWADPARLHREGRQARLLLDQAREAVAGEFGCRPDELSFTTSGTQAVHLAVLGAVQARQSAARGPGHLVASAVEHSSVLNAADWLARVTGAAVTLTAVNALGRADVGEFAAATQRDRTLLACLQSANHEVGTIQPVDEVAAQCQRDRVPLLVDAGASAGRLPAPDGWSLLTASARKWGGPAGVGVLASARARAGGSRSRLTTARTGVSLASRTSRRSWLLPRPSRQWAGNGVIPTPRCALWSTGSAPPFR